MHLTRRLFMVSTAAAGLSACGRDETLSQTTSAIIEDDPDLAAIEASLGDAASLGVFAKNHATGMSVSHRAGRRFAMCSTFKAPLAGLILREEEMGSLSLSDEISFTEGDLVPYAPFLEGRLLQGTATIEELCHAAVTVSDNPAANLLLQQVRGPDGFTQILRGLGYDLTRLDRWETELNENAPGDPRDTTTPEEMARILYDLTFGDILNSVNHSRMQSWMIDATTGLRRLRAGFPEDWLAGDKTGTSGNGAFNDIAFGLAPGSDVPLIITCYMDAPNASADEANAAHAEVARIVTGKLV